MLGVDYYIHTAGVKVINLPVRLNRLLIAASFLPDWDLFLLLLASRSTIHPQSVTSFDEKIALPHMLFLVNGHRVVYVTGGPLLAFQQMLNFVAHHNIAPIIDGFPLTLHNHRVCRGLVRELALSWANEFAP
jgi:D-arabinose 1-dehydrogenase-like Zn-dependent alcohol dehydrogenase